MRQYVAGRLPMKYGRARRPAITYADAHAATIAISLRHAPHFYWPTIITLSMRIISHGHISAALIFDAPSLADALASSLRKARQRHRCQKLPAMMPGAASFLFQQAAQARGSSRDGRRWLASRRDGLAFHFISIARQRERSLSMASRSTPPRHIVLIT